jgi:hypothetical protein
MHVYIKHENHHFQVRAKKNSKRWLEFLSIFQGLGSAGETKFRYPCTLLASYY